MALYKQTVVKYDVSIGVIATPVNVRGRPETKRHELSGR